jgi:hypothetical protein
MIAAMAKHLPPSASTMRVLDLNGATGAGAVLAALRPDLAVTIGEPSGEDHFDAIVAADLPLDADLLRTALTALRPGGRLIAVDAVGEPSAALVKLLENAGYTRILVEEAASASGAGVLLRGEKPHITDDTLARIQSVAMQDSFNFKGRYIHLLIRQTPNKPVWALKPHEQVEWYAAALAQSGDPLLLAFSSLPNAVAFMQPAVMSGRVKDVNKVAKFSRTTTQDWHLLINPALDVLQQSEVVFVPVNRAAAEAPDE